MIDKCREFGLRDIMGFKYDRNMEILAQFHCSYYFEPRDNTIHWITEGEHLTIDYVTLCRLLALGTKDAKMVYSC